MALPSEIVAKIDAADAALAAAKAKEAEYLAAADAVAAAVTKKTEADSAATAARAASDSKANDLIDSLRTYFGLPH